MTKQTTFVVTGALRESADSAHIYVNGIYMFIKHAKKIHISIKKAHEPLSHCFKIACCPVFSMYLLYHIT